MSATAFPFRLSVTLGALLAATAAAQTPLTEKSSVPTKTEAATRRISGPFTHENLTVFLIHGEDRIKNRDLLTLQEALKKKKVIVHETQQVNELAIENVSQQEVFVQAGDIVKGGRQDRVIAYDFIVPPKSGRIPIASFCVEAGRWQPRGDEKAEVFEASNQQAATKALKQAVRKERSQAGVWQNVDSFQKQLTRNAAIGSLAAASPTSLQLTLEDKKLETAVNGYLKKLGPIVQGKGDVIGYAVAVNGAVGSADVYASHNLFLKVWPTLLKGSAVEAVAENGSGLGSAGPINPTGGQGAGLAGGGLGGLGGGLSGSNLGIQGGNLGGGLGLQGGGNLGGGFALGGLGLGGGQSGGRSAAGLSREPLSGVSQGNGAAGPQNALPPKPAKPVTAAAVLAFLTDAEEGQPSQMDVTQRVGLLRRESGKTSLFISQDKAASGRPVLLRASYLAH
jgi:hypothetical protein